MIYPWSLEDRTGALAALHAYARALADEGLAVDLFGPGGPSANTGGDLPFDRRFSPPWGPDELVAGFEQIGEHIEDPLLPVTTGRDERALAAAAALAAMGDYRIVCVMYTRCHSVTRLLPAHVPRVLFTLDLDAIVEAQEAAIFGRASRYSLQDEVRRMRDFDLTTVVGPDDHRRVRSVDPDLPCIEATVPFRRAVDRPRIRHEQERRLLWLSAAAPFHAVSFQWFWQHVWPTLRAHASRPRLVMAGYICEVARELGADADPQVDLRGLVPDAAPLFAGADVMLAPYYYGDGIKVKVLEGIAHGLPVITTSRGLSNTRLVAGEHVAVADDGAQFVEQAAALLGDPGLRLRQATAALQYLTARHDPATAHRDLRDAIRRLVDRPRPSPARSVITHGALTTTLGQRVPALVRGCEQHDIASVAVYGAGMHTAALLPVWRDAGGPAIRTIVVTGRPDQPSLGQVPVIAADDFDPSQVDAIVLSSMMYEREMAATCRARWPDLVVVPIWCRPSKTPDTAAGAVAPGLFPGVQCAVTIPGEAL